MTALNRRDLVPALAVVAIVAIAIVGLRIEGRSWWCACGRPFLWTADAWGEHTSQHLLDPYGFTHILHGFVFWWALSWWWREGRGLWLLTAAVGIESVWEVLENSNLIIDRYRTATAALGYSGDTIANSFGDILCCVLGFIIAKKLGWRVTAALFVTTEVVLLIWIRDSLLLDIIMLIYPIDALKQWQMGH